LNIELYNRRTRSGGSSKIDRREEEPRQWLSRIM
jgi:hypothetical protein